MRAVRGEASMNEGRRLLLEALQATTRRALARRLEVSAMAISNWAAGRGVPTRYADRLALQREAGIPMVAWDETSNETALYTTSVTLRPRGAMT